MTRVVQHVGVLGRRRAAQVVSGLLVAGLSFGYGGRPARGVTSCGYAELGTPDTTTTVPLTSPCTTCPTWGDRVGPEGVHGGLVDALAVGGATLL